MFAPTSSPGGAAPVKPFETLGELREFMSDNLSLKPNAVDELIGEMERTEVGSLYPVTLTTRQIKRFGLV